MALSKVADHNTHDRAARPARRAERYRVTHRLQVAGGQVWGPERMPPLGSGCPRPPPLQGGGNSELSPLLRDTRSRPRVPCESIWLAEPRPRRPPLSARSEHEPLAGRGLRKGRQHLAPPVERAGGQKVGSHGGTGPAPHFFPSRRCRCRDTILPPDPRHCPQLRWRTGPSSAVVATPVAVLCHYWSFCFGCRLMSPVTAVGPSSRSRPTESKRSCPYALDAAGHAVGAVSPVAPTAAPLSYAPRPPWPLPVWNPAAWPREEDPHQVCPSSFPAPYAFEGQHCSPSSPQTALLHPPWTGPRPW